jgi:tetratricopeptide (TPR) repeat protein
MAEIREMNRQDTAVTDRKPMRIAPWTAVALLVCCLALTAAVAPPLEKHYEAARTALARGDTDKAKRELKLSLQDNPLHAESHFLLASLLGREGEIDQAIVGFQRTVTLAPNNAEARYNFGTALLWRGEPVSAARQIEDAIAIHPDYVPSYNNLVKAYFLARLPELAVASYKEALRRDPSNAIALKNLAVLTEAAGVQNAPGSGGNNQPAVGAGQPKKPVTSAPPVGAAVGNDKPPVVAGTPAISDADREARDAAGAQALQEILRDLPHVMVEWRGGRLSLGGWTSGPKERKLLDRILAGRSDVLDLTSDDTGDPHRLLEVDAVIFLVTALNSQSVGHNFLRNVQVNASVFDGVTGGWGWLYSAAITYQVNIANAAETQLALLARPHLTTLSGTPATFIAGGDIVYKVSGTTSGDIKPYPFGTSLDVTPTLLRTRGEDGSPRIHVMVKAGRKTILALEDLSTQSSEGSTVFANTAVSSEAVLGLGQTLILTGLNQRESQTRRSGVPVLKSIPIIKYLFSTKSTAVSDLGLIILLTPRDPAYWDEQNQKAIGEFVEKRRAYVQATQGTAEDMQRFKERYPDWDKLAPNRFASHFFLMENSDIYRRASGMDLATESLDFDLLGKVPKQKGKP